MKRAIAVAIALACVACGSSSDVPADPSAARPGAARKSGAANEAPTIDQAEIMPNPAGAADPLTLDLQARDAERDRLTTSVEWYKNGELVADVHGTVVERADRGDLDRPLRAACSLRFHLELEADGGRHGRGAGQRRGPGR